MESALTMRGEGGCGWGMLTLHLMKRDVGHLAERQRARLVAFLQAV